MTRKQKLAFEISGQKRIKLESGIVLFLGIRYDGTKVIKKEARPVLQKIQLENFCQHENLQWTSLQNINLIIGENSSGKTLLLKALYAALRTLEQYGKGNDKRELADILAEKLYWTFQVEALGDLVEKGKNALNFSMVEDSAEFCFTFGKDTNMKIGKIKNTFDTPRQNKSVFIPAKEVLSLFNIILKSRDQDSLFGFDDTYLDLVKALQIAPQRGRNFDAFADGRKKLEQVIKGKIEYDDQKNEWYYKRGNARFTIGMTSEGVKKIAIFNRLLSNRYLDNHAVIFIDELESALHPKAISDYLDMIFELSQAGIQFFIATHSYFVVKKLYLLAKMHSLSIPVLSLTADGKPSYDDMEDGMPDNSIIDESIRLYQQEVDWSLGG